MEKIQKNYKGWMRVKSNINNSGHIRKINEGDVVWVAVGENVGVEIDGKSEKYSRPVVVLRKHTSRCFTGVPLTSRPHEGTWYANFEFQNKQENAVLVQTRLYDTSRVYTRIGKLSNHDYDYIMRRYIELIQNKNMPQLKTGERLVVENRTSVRNFIITKIAKKIKPKFRGI